MTEIGNPEHVLERIAGFTPVQRVLLATAGTLQSTLAAYFAEPIDVEVVQQDADRGGFVREVRLVGRRSGLVACTATTEIDVTDRDVRTRIEEQRIGLGRMLAELGRQARFDFVDAGADATTFWRVYDLAGEGFRFRIREVFPTARYDP